MKNNIKILIASCLMLVCAANLSAQWRFGVEYNYLMMQKFYYNGWVDNEPYKELNPVGGMMGFVTFEYILPRKWTPNYLALSIRGQFGGGATGSNTTFTYYNSIYIDGEYIDIDNYNVAGLMIPIDIEAKFLMNNNCRMYFNVGIPNVINLASSKTTYAMGFEYGMGFEFGFFRIGYKNINFNKSFLAGNIGNKYNNIHSFTAAFTFNGNRFLKKKSSLKAY